MSEVEELREALAGMVYLYDRLGFTHNPRSTVDPMVEWINIIWRAKKLSAGSTFVPPANYPLASADALLGKQED